MLILKFTDMTKVDRNEVADDAGQSGMHYEAANVGIGAMMHEVGHLLGCPHQPDGIMLRSYVILNRSFTTRDLGGRGIWRATDECGWHRLDLLRLRCHPMFRFSSEPLVPQHKPILYPVENGAIASSKTGIYLIEVHVDGECRTHLEYPEGPQREIFLFEDELKSRLPGQYRNSKLIRLCILGLGQQQLDIDDFAGTLAQSRVDLGGRIAFTSVLCNPDTSTGTTPVRVLFRKIQRIKIYHGSAVDGLEFFYDSGTAMFGNRGGQPSDFNFEPGEKVLGLSVRVGAWVDAIQIITNVKRSAVYGNMHGGGAVDMMPPAGYAVVGIYGTVKSWLTRVGIIYTSDMGY